MNNLMPAFILRNYHQKIFSGELEAAVMFIDITGFTKMTQALMHKGKEGAEILTDAINEIFTPAIDAIYNYEGFISTFAGDAFTSIFPSDKTNISSALNAALDVQKVFQQIGRQKTRLGTFDLEVKIGLAAGSINWEILRTKKINSYYFQGKPIIEAANCEQAAASGEIVVSDNIRKNSNAEFEQKTINKFRLTQSKKIPSGIDRNVEESFSGDNFINKKVLSESILSKDFLPESILNLTVKGEFRNVISCFIAFDETDDFKQDLKKIISLSQDFSGYFNKIDIVDKGGLCLVVFGAPIMYEQNYERACDFAFRLRETLKIKCKIALSFGMVYAGFAGSKKRNEYTVLGTAVNLAARFVMKADWRQIYIDKFINKEIKHKYQTEDLGSIRFKGFSEKISTFCIFSQLEKQKISFSGTFIDRKIELQKLKKILDDERHNKAIYIQGEAGIGKSLLVAQLPDIITLTCDEILMKSFNPFLRFFKDYFKQPLLPDEKKFNSIFQNLVSKVPEKEGKLLSSSKPYIAALIGIYFSDQLLDKLDSKQKYENTLYGVRSFFLVLSRIKPLNLHFENAHVLDSDSKKMIKTISYGIENERINFLFTSRNQADGSQFDLQLESMENHNIGLQNFAKTDTANLVSSLLEVNSIPAKLTEIIHKKSTGNPLFITQLVEYLKEENALDDSLQIVKENFEIPTNLNSIIVAKIDRLNNKLKEVTKTASILGSQFTETVLQSMLKKKSIQSQIRDGEKEDIWNSISTVDYAFRNELIREGAYQLILKKDIRNLHKIAANSIYNIFRDQLEDHYADLTYNYQNAEILDKAVYFLEKAGDYAKEQFQNEAAIEYYNRLLKISKKINRESVVIEFTTKLKILELLILTGKIKKAEKIIIELEKFSLVKPVEKDKFLFLKAKLLRVQDKFDDLKTFINSIIDEIQIGKYKHQLQIYYLDSCRYLQEEFLKKAKKQLAIFKKEKNREFEGKVLNLLGVHSLNTSKYKEARKYFQEYHEIVDSDIDKNLIQSALHNLGVVNFRMGDSEAAIGYYNKALSICEEVGNRNAASKIISDLGALYSRSGDYDKAIESYKKGLAIAKTVGNYIQVGVILYNIANSYLYLDDLARSIDYVLKSKKICEKYKDKIGITYANDLLGDNFFLQEKVDQAENVYNENLILQKQIDDKEGICHTFGNLGNIAKVQKKYEKAEKYYRKQQKLLSEIGDMEGEGKAWFNWAMIEIERDRKSSAIEKLGEAIFLFKKCGFKVGIDLAEEQVEKYKS